MMAENDLCSNFGGPERCIESIVGNEVEKDAIPFLIQNAGDGAEDVAEQIDAVRRGVAVGAQYLGRFPDFCQAR